MGAAAPGQSFPATTRPAVTTWPPAVTPPPPPDPLPPPDPPTAPTSPAGQPRPTVWAPTPPTVETVAPKFGDVSQLAFPPDQKYPKHEPISESGSLYHSSRSCFPSAPKGEYQPNSPYVSHSVTSGAPVPLAPESLYSGPAEPSASATREETHRGQEGKALSGNRPEELELVRPLKDPSR